MKNLQWLRLNLILVVLILAWQDCSKFSPNSAMPSPDPAPDSSPGTSTAPTAQATPTPLTGRYRDPKSFNIGINLGNISSGNHAAIFADMAKAMAGSYGRWDAGKAEAKLDAGGNPTVAAQAKVTGNYPSGTYNVSWDGNGTLSVTGATMSSVTTSIVEGVQHNTATMTYVQNSTSALTFNTTPPTANIHILAPLNETYPQSYFLNDYIKRLKPFTALRFMGAQNINGNTISNWSQRTWPEEGSRATPGGFAYEDIIALANLLVVDVWVNVPVSATDDYVCRMARLFAYGEPGDKLDLPCDSAATTTSTQMEASLNTTSKIYLEYSNEIWGGIPANRQVVGLMASGQNVSPSAFAAAALANSTLPWSTNLTTKTSQLAKVLEKRISDIFKNVFGNQKSQIKFVSAIQYVYPGGSTAGFDFANSVYGSASSFIDYMGIAPYFQLDDSASGSLDAIFANLTQVALNPDPTAPLSVAFYLKADLDFANHYKLSLIGYEAGQGLKGAVNAANKIAAESDPRMYDMYQKYFSIWNQIIGFENLFAQFIDVGGMWGLLLNGADPGSQKWDAVMVVSQIAGDVNYDGIVDDKDCEILKDHFGETSSWWSEGDFNHDGVVDQNDLDILNTKISGAKCVL